MEKKIVVPEGMLKATYDRMVTGPVSANPLVNTRRFLNGAIYWLLDEVEKLELCQHDYVNFRRMFLAPEPEAEGVFDEDLVPIYTPKESGPITRGQVLSCEPIIPDTPEPEVPEDVDDLLWPVGCHTSVETVEQINNKRIIEAYRRGKEAK